MKVLRFKEVSFVVPMHDGETSEEVEDKVIEVMHTLWDEIVLSYRTEEEEWDDK